MITDEVFLQTPTTPRETLLAEDALFFRIAKAEEAGETIDSQEYAIFDLHNRNREYIENGVARAKSILKHQKKAGLATDFEAAQMESARLEKQIPNDVAELKTEIARLQQEINSWEIVRRQAKAKVDSMASARLSLRQAIPEFIKRQHERESMSTRRGTTNTEKLATETRLSTCRGVVATGPLTVHNRETILHHLRGIGKLDDPTFSTVTSHQGEAGVTKYYEIDKARWLKYVNDLQQEIPALEQRLKEISECFEQEKANADSLLEFYYPK